MLPLSPNCSHRAPWRTSAVRTSAVRTSPVRTSAVRTDVSRAGALLAPAMLLFSLACATPEEPKEVAIGIAALPEESGYAQVVRGVSLAVEALNQSPGVRFRVALPGDSALSAVALAAAHRSDPAVLAVVGHPESGHTLLALPVYAAVEAGGVDALTLVSPTASSPGLSGASRWFFRVAPSDAATARTVARFALDSLAAVTAAVVYRNDAYGRDWSAAFAEAWRRGGGATLIRDPYLSGATDWALYAAHVAARDPDVVLFPGDGQDAVAFLRALRAAGVRAAFIGGDGTAELDSPAAGTAGWAGNAHYVSFYRPDAQATPEADAFRTAWSAAGSETPDMFAALAYDAALAIGAAVRAAQPLTREGVRRALERVVREGASGRIAFDSVTHDITGRTIAVVPVGAATAGAATAGAATARAAQRPGGTGRVAAAPAPEAP